MYLQSLKTYYYVQYFLSLWFLSLHPESIIEKPHTQSIQKSETRKLKTNYVI